MTQKRWLVKHKGLYLIGSIGWNGGVWGDRHDAIRYDVRDATDYWPNYFPQFALEEEEVPQAEIDLEEQLNAKKYELANLKQEVRGLELKFKRMRRERVETEEKVKPQPVVVTPEPPKKQFYSDWSPLKKAWMGLWKRPRGNVKDAIEMNKELIEEIVRNHAENEKRDQT